MQGAERQFGVWLTDSKTGLSGKLDLLLKGEESAAVVDFKLTSGDVGENHRMQLAGYAVLVEAVLGLRVSTTFLFRIPDNRVFTVPITDQLRRRVDDALEAIRAMKELRDCPSQLRCGRAARNASMLIIVETCGSFAD